ncbi:hypothetical protein ACFV06_17485 [Streptomyces sp. NPDC059618]|uniref:hypothetical protein n=1 Tax=Streptomyces sp. NPDC059618 TaxID=3346887 RepID=UPI00367427F4
MSRGEQTPGETTGDEPAVPEEPAPAPGFAVVISGDGTAAIDGEPVPAADGVTVDAAILDVLHGYARDRGTPVTATVSDPSAGYVAYVEVAPDGSSTLMDQRERPEPSRAAEGSREPAESENTAAAYSGAGTAGDGPAEGSIEESAEASAGEAAPDEPLYEDADDSLDADDRAEDDLDDNAFDDSDADAYVDAYADDGDAYADADDGDGDGDAYGDGDDDDGDDDDGFDVDAYALARQRRQESVSASPPPPPPPSFPGGGGDLGASPGAKPVSQLAPRLVRRNGTRQSDDEYVGPGLLHRPLVVGPVALVAAALVIVPLVILGSGGSDDGSRQTQAARSSDETSGRPRAEKPGPISTSSTSMSPSPGSSASPSAGPKESKGAKESKGPKGAKGAKGSEDPGSGGGVTVTVTARPPQATVTAKPAQDTAATAVNRLARNDPSGRHICYRAYVSGQGWQKPVCDGTMAGTSGRNNPIKALNIAVSGGGGSAANAFVHKPGSTDGRGTWEPNWTAVIADGRNNYIGSTKKGAPVMSGFAINIGSGRICQSAKVHGFDWGAQGCADARPGYIFGGALENDRWLEAVKFTV